MQIVIRHGDRAPIHTLPNYELPHIPCKAHPELLKVAPFYEEFTRRLSKPEVSTTTDHLQQFALQIRFRFI